MTRYTYDLEEIEDFKELLDFWVRTKEIYYPVFVNWHSSETDTQYKATFWLETELYRAKITVYKSIAEDIYEGFSQKFQGKHKFIECIVYADGEED